MVSESYFITSFTKTLRHIFRKSAFLPKNHTFSQKHFLFKLTIFPNPHFRSNISFLTQNYFLLNPQFCPKITIFYKILPKLKFSQNPHFLPHNFAQTSPKIQKLKFIFYKIEKIVVPSSSITSFQSFAFLTTKINIVFRLYQERHAVKIFFFKTGNLSDLFRLVK